ncbi:MAG: hypothetical protein RL291_1383 [Pseudomonadota bacterium]|jgi:glutathione S-transferase
MKIIETRSAPNPRRVRIFLAEKALNVTFEQIEFSKTAFRSPEFTALNRQQKIPVLVLDDGTAISETVAICRYFEELHPTPPLFGKGPVERAQVEMWQRRMELYLLFYVAQAFRHLHPSMTELEMPQVPQWGEANKPRAIEQLYILDEQLGKTEWVAGKNYSIADITALIAIDFMRPARIQRPEGLKNIERWYAAMQARPSTKA